MRIIKALIAAAAVSAGFAHAADATKYPSGLEVTITKEGNGAQPTARSVVTVNYRGTLATGQEFDSSYKRGQPASFALSRVIPCWTEGLQKIKVGSAARLLCPPGLAYGSDGVAGVVPPGATLIFEVELLDVKN